MATTPVPNLNVTGVIGSGAGNVMPGQNSTGFSAFGGTGGAGTMGFGNASNPNPTQPSNTNPFNVGGVRPMDSSMNPGGGPALPGMPGGGAGKDSYSGYVTSEGSTTAAANPYGLSQSQMNWMQKYLQETYGGGMGALVMQYLGSNGGYNSTLTGQAVAAQTNAMEQQRSTGANDLSSRLGAMGVSGSSSEMSGALQSYENTATTQENAITAQEYYNMWNASQEREANMMEFAATGTGKTLANKPTGLDYLNEGLGLLSSAGTFMGGLAKLEDA